MMIIKSLLDTDYYKFSMGQLVFHQYPNDLAEYKFTCRTKGIDLTPYKEEIESEIKHLESLSFSEDELSFLGSARYMKSDYINFLRTLKLKFEYVNVYIKDGILNIRVRGPWKETIYFEVLVLSIVNEVYFRNTQNFLDKEQVGLEKLHAKIDLIKSYNEECKAKGLPLFSLSDFGTRRRYSSEWQGVVDTILKKEIPENLVGSSSVYWAKELGMKVIGTQAHEYFQAHQVLASSLLLSQKESMRNWLKEYPHDLGIALSDIYGTDSFLNDFDYELASKFIGARQDSGDPFVWGERLISHYESLGIDPKSKLLVFSDGLDVPKAIELHRRFAGRIQINFGIGTNLTNDFDFKALNIVMKMIYMNGKPVCKISDEPSKAMCESAEFLDEVKRTFLIAPYNTNYKELGFYKVKAVSPILTLGSPKENAKKMIQLAQKESKESAVILFPELSLTGYTCEDLFFSSDLIQQVNQSIKKVLDETKDVSALLIFGAPFQNTDGRLYNCAFISFKGKLLGIVPKIHLPNYNEFYEKRWFTSGKDVHCQVKDKVLGDVLLSNQQLFKFNELIVGVEICEDLWSVIPPSSYLALAGANLIVNLSASNELVAKSEYRRELVKQQSARLSAAYLYSSASLYESTKDLVFSGHCLIAENGSLLKENEKFSFEDSVLSCEIDVHKLLHERRKNTTFSSEKAPTYLTHEVEIEYKLSEMTRLFSKTPFIPQTTAMSIENINKRFQEVLTIQSVGLARRLIATQSKSVVLGLSGGLDSTLAFIVAIEALEKIGKDVKSLKCISMPGFGTSSQTKKSARDLAKAFGVDLREISIVPSVNQHFKDIGHDPLVINNTYENSQARERTQILFDIANDQLGLVLGTGDLSEQALGWSTYGGDQISSYNVNSSIPKTLVKKLIENYKNRQLNSNKRSVLESILSTTISPELTPEQDGKIQSTEDLIGPYILHDFYLFHFIRHGYSKTKIKELATLTFKNEFSKEDIVKWLDIFFKRFYLNQFKRTMMPAGPKVGSVSLSPRGDFRLPDELNFDKME